MKNTVSFRARLIRNASSAAGFSSDLANTLIREAPWLICEEVMHPDIVLPMLAGVAQQYSLDVGALRPFLDALNEVISDQCNLSWIREHEAYEALSAELARHGIEDVGEGGDYWLNSDDFSQGAAEIDLFGSFRLNEAALRRLADLLRRHGDVLKLIRIKSADGTLMLSRTSQ